MNRKFLLFALSTTFMIASGLGVGLWVATLAIMLPKFNAKCIVYGTDGLIASVLNGNQTVKKGRVRGKDPRVRENRKIVQIMIFHHHLNEKERVNSMMATTVVLVQFGYKLVVRTN